MKVRIEMTYKTPKGTEAYFKSEDIRAGEAVLLAEDFERTGRIKNVVFLDKYDTTWTLKDLNEYIKGIETEPHDITVYFDGGYDLKTRESGLGCAIYYTQNGKSLRLRKNALVEQLGSNNEAEYAALLLALQELEDLGVHHLPVRIVGDSQVVINQLNGEWPCLEEELSNWADRVETKLDQLGIEPEYKVVSRKKNREADRLATQALEGTEITSTSETKHEG
ncbi:reverse transcriptase-like protein [Thalassobacillus pellis]|uniref:reverse transcriptase-like protein n=1 Tax=Thalassobacillus pellis TaxID=748008 RepID=UPI00195F75D5|nr:reverse transcriptase-like protein [Thalassobacillus pellis]MBM7553159.1 ribonuclease HI [Thalassobacillus pellis]